MDDGCPKCTIAHGIINTELSRIRRAEKDGKPITRMVEVIKDSKRRLRECADSGHEGGLRIVDNAGQARYGHDAVYTTQRVANAKLIPCPECQAAIDESCHQISRAHGNRKVTTRPLRRPHKARVYRANPELEAVNG